MKAKQVMDLRSTKTGIPTNVSNEEQRKWTDVKWQRKLNDSTANYNRSRSHLNFEIAKGGIVRPIDTSKTIAQKMKESLAARGIKNPNEREGAKQMQRIAAQFIFGGSRERMHEIAFGNYIDFKKDKDYSNLTRSRNIEKWAKDIYDFVSRHFGEENIMGFYVHLDELNPHIHCTVVPVNEKNKISWTSVFGKTMYDEKMNLLKLHDALYNEVSCHWGLERGDSVEETKARHISTEEYRRNLVRDVKRLENDVDALREKIRRSQIELKGLSTMIANLQQRKESIDNEINLLAKELEMEGADTNLLLQRMKDLRTERFDIDKILAKRYQQIENAKGVIADAKAEIERLEAKDRELSDVISDKLGYKAKIVEAGVAQAYNVTIFEMLSNTMETLPSGIKNTFDTSGLTHLAENMNDIINCAMMLAVNYVDDATTYAESCGGGGSSSDLSGWGRKDDESDEQWWLRCISKATEMTKPATKRYSMHR